MAAQPCHSPPCSGCTRKEQVSPRARSGTKRRKKKKPSKIAQPRTASGLPASRQRRAGCGDGGASTSGEHHRRRSAFKKESGTTKCSLPLLDSACLSQFLRILHSGQEFSGFRLRLACAAPTATCREQVAAAVGAAGRCECTRSCSRTTQRLLFG